MKKNFFDSVQIDEHSLTPKYLQLVNGILDAIEEGIIKKDEHIPSINELSIELDISRDTAEKGYKHLKKAGVIGSIPGKGFYVLNDNINQKVKIFLLFNKLSAHKKIIYDSFVAALGENAAIDFYIYDNNFSLFKKFLNRPKIDYSHFVIIPHFIEGGDNAHDIINTIPKEKLILLDKKINGVTGEYGAVYENFEKDIYEALEKAIVPLSKYHTLKIIFPENSYYPEEILKGFARFCQEYAFSYSVVNNIAEEPIGKGEVYINLMEDDLVTLIDRVMAMGLEVGKDIGIISYNETPLKRLILKGITTMSTDFRYMGSMAAKLVLEKSRSHIEVPFVLTLRPSL